MIEVFGEDTEEVGIIVEMINYRGELRRRIGNFKIFQEKLFKSRQKIAMSGKQRRI